MWSHRHMSKPEVERLRFQSWVHSNQLGQFADVV